MLPQHTGQFSKLSKYRRKLSFYRKYRNYRSPCHAWKSVLAWSAVNVSKCITLEWWRMNVSISGMWPGMLNRESGGPGVKISTLLFLKASIARKNLKRCIPGSVYAELITSNWPSLFCHFRTIKIRFSAKTPFPGLVITWFIFDKTISCSMVISTAKIRSWGVVCIEWHKHLYKIFPLTSFVQKIRLER